MVQWLEDTFLGYLNQWKSSVEDSDMSPAEKSSSQLSKETLEGSLYHKYVLII